jgi:hypothetical protein
MAAQLEQLKEMERNGALLALRSPNSHDFHYLHVHSGY